MGSYEVYYSLSEGDVYMFASITSSASSALRPPVIGFKLNSDGTFSASELVVKELWNDRWLVASGGGRWRLGRAGDQAIWLTFTVLTGSDRDPSVASAQLFVHPGFGGTRLVYFKGDPDLGESFRFAESEEPGR